MKRENTVFGIREAVFRAHWVSWLWYAMSKTGKGYRRPSMKRNGRGERRLDKTGLNGSKVARRLMLRCQVA